MTHSDGKIESPILESSWQRYAEFRKNSTDTTARRVFLVRLAVILALAAVIMAVLIDTEIHLAWPVLVSESFRIGLVVVLIIDFIVLAMAIGSTQSQSSQALRAAAEEIKKEIYLYRTVMQWHDRRDHWLSQRVAKIKRDLADSFGGELALRPYKEKIPPDYNPEDPNSDPGMTRLIPEDYLLYRLENQLAMYAKKITKPQRERNILYIGLFITGGLSLLLAAVGSQFTAWTAVAIFGAAALLNWFEPVQLDARISNYNQLILGLHSIKDHWQGLNTVQKTGEEFFKLVIATERVIWSQYGVHSNEIWRAVDDLEGQEQDALYEVSLNEVMLLPAADTLDYHDQSEPEIETVVAEIVSSDDEDGAQAPTEIERELEEEKALALAEVDEIITPQKSAKSKPKKGLPHAFVVMPFGRKQGHDGRWYDFDAIYHDLIRPSLEGAGFESFRADEESVSGDILTDMFQELLLADLVIADLSIDNANVFYELGVRHAMRKRGLVHIQSGRAYMPFDIFNVRTIPYQTDKNGRPDPVHLEKDKQTITKISRETWASDIDRIHSPIFNLLDGLIEPDRKTLRTPLATGFWREYNEWRERVAIARRQKRIGDILLLTEEISNPLIKEEAIGEAGRALRGMGRFELALQQYRQGLEVNPRNTSFRREEAFHLNRLNRTDEAIVKLERLLKDAPGDTEAISFLGRIYKQMWMETWDNIEDTRKRKKEAYESSHWLIKAANTYLEGYRINQNDYYPGINALSMAVFMDFLATEFHLDDDPDVIAIREELPKLKGAIHFALDSTTRQATTDYWALVSLAELEVNIADDPVRVTRAYKKALTAARKNIYNLKSSLAQLVLMQSIGFRKEFVQVGIDVLQGEINRISFEEEAEDAGGPQDPPQVFIFAGHTIDRPKQPNPVFPPEMEREARERIGKTLDKFKANDNDLAFSPGAAAGGDIIFIEVCLKHNMRVEIHLPFAEAAYLKDWVSFAGDEWIERFYAIRNNPNVSIRLQADHVGKVKAGDNVHERNERWTLYSSLVQGVDRMRLILLWDGVVDDIPGGPDNMLEEVRHLGGRAEHLNTTKFDYWKAGGKVSKALDLLVDL